MNLKAMKNFFNKIIYPVMKLYWFVFRPNTRGVKCIMQNGENILLIRNSYGSGVWTFPGGGIKKGETTEEAIRREIKEEVGVDVQGLKKIGEFESQSEYKKDNVQVFLAQVGSQFFKIDPSEILEAKWFDINTLPDISSQTKRIISMLKTG